MKREVKIIFIEIISVILNRLNEIYLLLFLFLEKLPR